MARRTLQELYKEWMSNPHRTPMPGKTKHESAMEAAHKQLLQSYNNDMALSLVPKDIEAQYVQKRKIAQQKELIENISKEDISNSIAEIIKQLATIGTGKDRAKAKGLVPQSGDENHPGRWVKPGNQAKKKDKKPIKGKKSNSKPGATNKVQSKNAPSKKSY